MIISKGETDFFIADFLIKHWKHTNLELMKKTNQDRVYIVDGRERIGKSTWTMQQAAYLDDKMWKTPESFVKRICFTPDDFYNAVRYTSNGVIIFDEAFRGLSSRSALSKVNRKLLTALMEMGQNNNMVFIILPSVFRLDSYAAVERSHGLFNIYLGKDGKRQWRGWNTGDKNKIYNMGVKKAHNYPIRTQFRGRFPGKFPYGKEYEDAYLKKKMDSLRNMDNEAEQAPERKHMLQKEENIQILLRSCVDLTGSYTKASDFLKTKGLDISKSTIGGLLAPKQGENP